MLSPLTSQAEPRPADRQRRGLVRLFLAWIQHRPFLALFLVIVGSNASGSVFNILYNFCLIGERYLDPGQRKVFEEVALPAYNVAAYPLGLGAMAYLFWPLSRCRYDLRARLLVPPARLESCRRRLVRLPVYALLISLL